MVRETSTSKVLVSCSDLMFTSFCPSRAAFVVYCTSVHKITLLYKCTQNYFTIQVYTKLVDCTSVHKSGNYNGMYGDGTLPPFLPLLPLPASTYLLPSSACLFLSLPASAFLYLPLPAFSCEIQHYGQTHRQTDTLNICTSRAASLQLKRKLKKIETWYSLKRD